MRIRNFQAESVRDALRQVKEELGPDAVILKTTAIEPAGRRGASGRRSFQVTACVDANGLSLPKDRSFEGPPPDVDRQNASDMTGMLRAIQRDVRHLINSGRIQAGSTQIDDRLIPYLCELTDAGIEPGLAEQLVTGIDSETVQFDQDNHVRLAIAHQMVSRINEPVEIRHYAKRASSVAIVGAPGTGKSSLTAKLASHLLADLKKTVTLATLDDFRPMAADEMQRFAKALKVPCITGDCDTVGDPDGRVILIDTPGVSIGSEKDRDSLKTRLDRAGVTEVHLVLPAYCGYSEMLTWYDFFAPIGLTAVAVTSLDQVSTAGAIASLCMLRDTNLSYTSTGRMSARHIRAADPVRLALDLIGVSEDEL